MKGPKIVWRDLHGLLLLDKPLGLSSNQALQIARRVLRAAKGGHTGALDPLATGLLPLCFGEGTKIAGTLLGARKAYVAECRLGATTRTADLEGEVIERRPLPLALGAAMVEAALAPLRGRITQVPPAYSAIKQDGEPLYLKARRGEAVEAPSREVEVFRLERLAQEDDDVLRLLIECGSGTYIRSLAVDLGEALGCGAHLISLRRLWVAPFLAPTMVTLEQLTAAVEVGEQAALDALILPVEAGLVGLPRIELDQPQSMAMAQGRSLQRDDLTPVARAAVFADDGRLLALAEVDLARRLKVLRGFNLPRPERMNAGMCGGLVVPATGPLE